MSISGKKIVLTGATGGIGLAMARELDHAGARLLLSGRSDQKLQDLLATLKGKANASVVADLTSPQGVLSLTAKAQAFRAEILINCLGVNQLATLDETKEEDTVNIMATNLIAPINVCRSLLPGLKTQPQSTIINVGSILGSIGYPGSTLYCASKFGLRGFTEALRRELSDTQVRVVYFAPRATNTSLNTLEMNQMNVELGNDVDSPETVAKKLVHLLESGKSTNRYLGWPEKLFVFINSLFPAMVDNAVSKKLATIKRYCRLGQPC